MLTLRIVKSLACSLPLVLLTLGSVSATPNASSQIAESFTEDSATYIAQNSNVIMQTQGVLQRGDSTLDDGSLFRIHSFSGRAGQRVTINLESDEFDTYLILMCPSREIVAQNDDASGTTNSSITVTLDQTGEYYVVANGYDQNSRGRYRVTVLSSR